MKLETEDLERADPLLEMRGCGKAMWEAEPVDEFIKRMRSDDEDDASR